LCVTVDKDTGIEPIWLHVFSKEKHIFERYYEYEDKRWEPIPDIPNSRTCILGEAPKITPAAVREQIVNYISQLK